MAVYCKATNPTLERVYASDLEADAARHDSHGLRISSQVRDVAASAAARPAKLLQTGINGLLNRHILQYSCDKNEALAWKPA